MINLINEMEQIYFELSRIEKRIKDETKDFPIGTLRIARTSKNPDRYQYYHCTKDSGRNGNYIKKADMELATHLAQKEYNEKLLRVINDNKEAIVAFSKKYSDTILFRVYDALSIQKKQLITPYVISNEEYASQWQQTEYSGLPFTEGSFETYTERGERVRSKSEKMIADKLYYSDIPYRYEYPLKVAGNEIYPDFTILNVNTREEFIWEHFGMMDKEEYAEKAYRKIERYEMNGYIPGKNLIITHETGRRLLSSVIVDKMIDGFLR